MIVFRFLCLVAEGLRKFCHRILMSCLVLINSILQLSVILTYHNPRCSGSPRTFFRIAYLCFSCLCRHAWIIKLCHWWNPDIKYECQGFGSQRLIYQPAKRPTGLATRLPQGQAWKASYLTPFGYRLAGQDRAAAFAILPGIARIAINNKYSLIMLTR